MSHITIKTVHPKHEDLHKLIAHLDRYLLTLYPPEEIFVVDFSTVDLERFKFVVAYDDDIAIGCGGIKRLSLDEVELKRFFVHPSQRNKGIASQLLTHLEKLAIAQHARIMKLEAGEPQFEAIHFYTKAGFKRIDRFGEYINSESSVCMEKKLV